MEEGDEEADAAGGIADKPLTDDDDDEGEIDAERDIGEHSLDRSWSRRLSKVCHFQRVKFHRSVRPSKLQLKTFDVISDETFEYSTSRTSR